MTEALGRYEKDMSAPERYRPQYGMFQSKILDAYEPDRETR